MSCPFCKKQVKDSLHGSPSYKATWIDKRNFYGLEFMRKCDRITRQIPSSGATLNAIGRSFFFLFLFVRMDSGEDGKSVSDNFDFYFQFSRPSQPLSDKNSCNHK